MTIDEAIKHAEEVAEEHERNLKVYENMDEDRPLFRKEENECKDCAEEHRQLAEWLKELKQLREQEPCEDAVSRSAAINKLKEHYFDKKLQSAKNDPCIIDAMTDLDIRIIKALPPVTPTKCIATVKFSKEDMQELVNEKMKNIVVERKKGKWINKSQKSGCGITFVASECTCCGKKTLFNCDELIYKYCPNCGAEMEGEE